MSRKPPTGMVKTAGIWHGPPPGMVADRWDPADFQGWEPLMQDRSGRGGNLEAKGRPISRARLAGVLAFLILGIGPVSGAIASPITIMPLGDSITYGYSDPVPVPGGYRSVLYRDLVGAGYTPQFVGSLTNNPDPTLPAAAQAHEGHAGWLIAGTGRYASYSVSSYIGQWLAPGNGINPNLILLELGSNEYVGRYHEAAAPYELAALITRIAELRPNAEILVSTISPLSEPTFNARVQAFNNALSGPDGLVAQLQKRGEKVILVNAGGSLAVSDLAHDGVHPTQAGYVKLGDAWFKAIQSLNGPVPIPAPEPSTLLVLGCGFLGLLSVARAGSRANPRS